MSKAADMIVEALRAFPVGTAPTKAAEVRALTGLSPGLFAGAVRMLRFQGSMDHESFELSPSTRGGAEWDPSCTQPETAFTGPPSDCAKGLPAARCDSRSGPEGGSVNGGVLDANEPPQSGGRGETSAAPAELRREVDAEAAQAARNRRAARSTGSVVRKNGDIDRPTPDDLSTLTMGEQLQDLALRNDPLAAAGIVRDQWEDVWRRVVRHGKRTLKRPVPAMLDLINRGLAAEKEDRRV